MSRFRCRWTFSLLLCLLPLACGEEEGPNPGQTTARPAGAAGDPGARLPPGAPRPSLGEGAVVRTGQEAPGEFVGGALGTEYGERLAGGEVVSPEPAKRIEATGLANWKGAGFRLVDSEPQWRKFQQEFGLGELPVNFRQSRVLLIRHPAHIEPSPPWIQEREGKLYAVVDGETMAQGEEGNAVSYFVVPTGGREIVSIAIGAARE